MKSLKKYFSFATLIVTLIFTSCNIEPFEGDIPENIVEETPEETLPSTCEEAAENTQKATLDYSNASSSDANYVELCGAYKKALQDQITVCGDTTGVFQTLIDSLDCGSVDESANGDYWPMNIGNIWVFSAKINDISQNDATMEIAGLEDYNGFSSYYYENFLGAVQATDGTGLENVSLKYYTRKDDGDYYISIGEMSAQLSGLYDITQSAYEYIILKDYLDVGEEWNTNFDVATSYSPIDSSTPQIPSLTTNYDINCKILEKDATVMVKGETFTSVIKLSFEQSVKLQGFPASSATVKYIYYFAKDVGIVKVEGSIFDADDNITSSVLQELTSYTID